MWNVSEPPLCSWGDLPSAPGSLECGRVVTRHDLVTSGIATTHIFQSSLLTPLSGFPSCFTSMNRPVSVSRFTHWSVFGLWVWLRSSTAPRRNPSPVFFAIALTSIDVDLWLTTVMNNFIFVNQEVNNIRRPHVCNQVEAVASCTWLYA